MCVGEGAQFSHSLSMNMLSPGRQVPAEERFSPLDYGTVRLFILSLEAAIWMCEYVFVSV